MQYLLFVSFIFVGFSFVRKKIYCPLALVFEAPASSSSTSGTASSTIWSPKGAHRRLIGAKVSCCVNDSFESWFNHLGNLEVAYSSTSPETTKPWFTEILRVLVGLKTHTMDGSILELEHMTASTRTWITVPLISRLETCQKFHHSQSWAGNQVQTWTSDKELPSRGRELCWGVHLEKSERSGTWTHASEDTSALS